MSANHILKLRNPKWASHEARHHPLVRQICEKHKCADEIERTLLEDLVEYAVLVAYCKAANDAQLPTWETDLNLKIEAVSSQFLTREQMKPLIDLGDCLVKATRDLADNPEGVNYDVDKLLGTNMQVFSILGPHTVFMQACQKILQVIFIKPKIMETTGKIELSLSDVKSEAHLPSLIPLSFVDKIIIPKSNPRD
ncbi:hypothetical protein BC938DRAFT_477675, partial [Jimgerdemannia flammicorona]